MRQVDRDLFSWNLDDRQSLGFQYFHLQTLPILRTFNHSTDVFYGRCVAAMAVTDDVIRRMTVAIGLFHLEGLRQQPFESFSALKEYGYSLKQLSRCKASDHITMLTACLLFVSIEMLRGRFFHAIMHVQRGMDILAMTGCDGSKYRSADPLCDLEILHLRVIISQIAETAGLVNFVRDGTHTSEQLAIPDLGRDLENYQEARQSCRQLARWCLNVGEDTEQTIQLWHRWHIRCNLLTRRLLSSSKTGVIDVPLLL